ncbi:MAG TPA: J domain-containing protein [Anaeromyxobacter sp.]
MRAIVPVPGAAGANPVAGAEARLREVVAEVTRLDAEIESLSEALGDFARRWERAVSAAYADLSAAERLVRRLQALEQGLTGLAATLRAGDPQRSRRPIRRARRARRRAAEASEETDDRDADAAPPSQPPPAEDPAPEVLPAEVALKRLYRRLARVLHPDLAQDDGERARLGDLMARANAAYAKGDLTALEVMAEKVGAGEPPGELSEEERRAHLERRIATLERIAASLARERARLERSDTHRLRAEALRREAEGEDFLAAARADAEAEAVAAYEDALARLARLAKAAREVGRARSIAMKEIQRRGPTGARRAFDPLEEAELVRVGAARLERSRATPRARELARTLEDRAAAAPAEVGLTLLAYFAEDAAGRPPDALADAAGWSLRWDRLRENWPGAADLPRTLARLPSWLAVGARRHGDDVLAGVQLADAELAAGVRIALEHADVAAIARDVLAALGPDLACEGCGAQGPGVHLHRTRGLDELNGIACASCGRIARSYWRYGEADGLEALAPHALRLGVVAEATAQLAGTAIGFQMLPSEREALTAAQLRRRFAELYLAPYEAGVDAAAVGVAEGKDLLAPSAHVGPKARLRFSLAADAGTTAEELLELLRARIERRFRP